MNIKKINTEARRLKRATEKHGEKSKNKMAAKIKRSIKEFDSEWE